MPLELRCGGCIFGDLSRPGGIGEVPRGCVSPQLAPTPLALGSRHRREVSSRGVRLAEPRCRLPGSHCSRWPSRCTRIGNTVMACRWRNSTGRSQAESTTIPMRMAPPALSTWRKITIERSARVLAAERKLFGHGKTSVSCARCIKPPERPPLRSGGVRIHNPLQCCRRTKRRKTTDPRCVPTPICQPSMLPTH